MAWADTQQALWPTALYGDITIEKCIWMERLYLPFEHELGLEDSDTHLGAGHTMLALHDGAWCGITASCEDLGSNIA